MYSKSKDWFALASFGRFLVMFANKMESFEYRKSERERKRERATETLSFAW